MAWLAVDLDKKECIFSEKPYRMYDTTWVIIEDSYFVDLPFGTIEKLIGKKMTWEDEPVEIK